MYEDVLCSLESIMKSYKDNISQLYSENAEINSKEYKIINLVKREGLDVSIIELNILYYMYTAYLEQHKSYLNAALEHKNTKLNDSFNINTLQQIIILIALVYKTSFIKVINITFNCFNVFDWLLFFDWIF